MEIRTRQKCYTILFEELEPDVYNDLLEYLKDKNFTIKGFRELRTAPRKMLVRELSKDAEIMSRTLRFLALQYELEELKQKAEEQLETEDDPEGEELDLKKLIEEHPERKNGLRANYLLHMTKSTEKKFGQELLQEYGEQLTGEEKQLVEDAGEEWYQETEEECLEVLFPELYAELQKKPVAEKKEQPVPEKAEHTGTEQEKVSWWKEKYEEEQQRNRELSKKNKSQKIEIGMLKEQQEKWEKLANESSHIQKDLKEKNSDLQQRLAKAESQNAELTLRVKEMEEVLERPHILYIGNKRDIQIYCQKCQLDIQEEDTLDWENLSVGRYTEIWLVENEVASLYNKRELRRRAKTENVPVRTFYGNIDIVAYAQTM